MKTQVETKSEIQIETFHAQILSLQEAAAMGNFKAALRIHRRMEPLLQAFGRDLLLQHGSRKS